MKILYILNSFPPLGGGAQMSTSLIIKEISKKHDCSVLINKVKDKGWKFGDVSITPLLKRTFPKDYSPKELIRYSFSLLFALPSNFFITKKFIRNNNPDLINITFIDYHFIPSVLASIFEKKPVILDIRGGSLNCPTRSSTKLYSIKGESCKKNCYTCRLKSDIPSTKVMKFFRPAFVFYDNLIFKLWNFMLKRNIKNIDMFVANSQFVARQLVIDGVPKNKIKIIYNISESPNFKVKSEKKKNQIVFAGRLERDKGIWDAIKAFEFLKDKNLKFIIAGEGSEYDLLKRYVKSKRLHNIKVIGKIPNKQVLNLYSKSKIIIAPSIVPEAFGRFILESFASKTPLITTPVGGNPEGIKHKKTGFLVPPGDPKKLAYAIKKLLENTKLYNTIMKNIEKEIDRYSSGEIGKQRLELYKKVILKHQKSISFNKPYHNKK